MNLTLFPAWLSWLMLLAIIWLFIQVQMLQAQVAVAKSGIKNKQELEDAYSKGWIGRDEYERLKGRVK